MSTPFRERNPVVVGAISLAVVGALILLAFNADKLPIIGGGTTYYADFILVPSPAARMTTAAGRTELAALVTAVSPRGQRVASC